jgi:GNAT superfamily N-acetyltransferase
MGEVELVLVGPAEEGALLALARAFHDEGGHPLTERGVAAIGMVAKGHPLARAWLIREGAEVVGYTVLGFGFGIEYGGPDAFIDDLYLVPHARGRGLGAEVMERLEAEARAMGAGSTLPRRRPREPAGTRPLRATGLRRHALAPDGETALAAQRHSSAMP